MSKGAQWDHVAFVVSDSDRDPFKRYEIKRRQSDGHYGCSCMAYRFRKGVNKTCKHIDAVVSGLGLGQIVKATRQPVHETAVSRVTNHGETFTVTARRSISFGTIPGGV